MRANTTVKIAREKLLELLAEERDKRLANFDKKAAEFEANLAKARESLVKTAAADLTDEKRFSLHLKTVNEYERLNKVFYPRRSAEDRLCLKERYDDAIRLVGISADDVFRVGAETEFGRLLGF